MKATDKNLLEVCNLNRESAYKFKERRLDPWMENYTLYRDTVIVNRLTQRQSVNIPLMRGAVKTLLKDIDDAPLLYYNCLGDNPQKELYYNEYWKDTARKDKLIIKDIVDKKQALLFGRTFKKLQIENGRFTFSVIPPHDMLVDRYVDPTNLDTASFISHTHIFRTLRQIQANDYYDKEAISRLIKFYATKQGLITNEENQERLTKKNEMMSIMGVEDIDSPILGETVAELNEDFMYLEDPEAGEQVLHLVVSADSREVLFTQPLYKIIGDTKDNFWYNHSPFVSWGEDPESIDFWNDGPADTLRTPNKVLNSWISQLVENRTLKNYGMTFYDSSKPDFVPQTYEPVPWGWYPTPGDPNKTTKRVDIPDLSDGLDELNFVMSVAEKASAATSASQGAIEKSQVTLGEIQLTLGNAQERVKSLTPIYTDAWEEFGTKYAKILEAAPHLLEEVSISKKGREGKKMYTRMVKPQDWMDEEGYSVEVRDLSQGADKDIETIQKLQGAKSIMPNNKPLDDILKRKSVEFAGLTATEVKEVMEFEKQMPEIDPMTGMPVGTNPMSNTPQNGALPPNVGVPIQ